MQKFNLFNTTIFWCLRNRFVCFRVSSMPIDIESPRPRSALLRGVQITEFKGHIINPDPIVLQETDLLLEEFLSPTKLVKTRLLIL